MANSSEVSRWLSWALIAAPLLHICDEFVFPGGFVRWYRAYRGAEVTSITPRFLVIINAVMVVTCIDAAYSIGEASGVALWLGMAALMATNGVWHDYAALRSRTYSPGMVTGTLVYIPLAIVGTTHFLRSQAISPGAACAVMATGATFPYWSDWYHRRSRAKQEPIPVP